MSADRFVHDARDIVELDPSKPHPLAPPGSPTIAEERRQYAESVARHAEIAALANRQDHIVTRIDAVCELISSQLLTKIDRLADGITTLTAEQGSTIRAVNGLAVRVDTMAAAIGALDSRISGLEKADAALGRDLRITEEAIVRRVEVLEAAVAKLADPPKRPKRVTARR